ncbi:agglutinin alpha chain isoform X2 [Morus notabilis]|uniref:agglutinin alpha chain isoform X1 n=1 Tax=Morus notabilis TaxID=981085 RepID=UPI000CED2CBE|nr:agglutinin alpha chain isoform X1 [Morus notabilis]XP_024023821.1 agglutinin alpha chain isoform X2 [Morus notabilis]
MASQTVAVGNWGGPGGNAWDDGSYTGVRSIELTYGNYIGTFNVVYDLNGEPFDGPKHSSNRPLTTAKIELQFPDEYLVKVSGIVNNVPGASPSPTIQSLTFQTNQRTFGPYGPETGGTPFSLPIRNGLIVGFSGRTGEVLDAIGVHLAL